MSDKLKVLNDGVELKFKCPRCHIRDMEDDHPCPYAVEIEDDNETMCNCCSKCEHECAMDI